MTKVKQIENIEQFETKLKGFVNAQKLSMKYALALSIFTIQHFEECGDLGPAQRLHDSMVKNYTRRPAYLKWLSSHAPVEMEKGKLKKDKGPDAVAFDLDGAMKKPFWEFAPEQQAVPYTLDDIKAAVLRTIKTFENEKKYVTNQDPAVVLEIEKFRNLAA